MAQAFARIGCQTTIVQMDAHLLPFADRFAGEQLEELPLKRRGLPSTTAVRSPRS
jgi:pyruvate/2-oxoglutarate dehydrogenase complex dihydrolipoamide dehydrogenase (E3) component